MGATGFWWKGAAVRVSSKRVGGNDSGTAQHGETGTRDRIRGRAGMRRILPLLLLTAACATGGRIPGSVPPPLVRAEGAHFSIVCHFDCGSSRAALEAAEHAWERTSQLLGVAGNVSTPRPIHLYGTERDYEAVEGALTGGRLRLNRAMTYRGAEAHISVHPNLTPQAMSEFGLTANTLRVVAHEAAHIAARSLSPRTRNLPDWLDEGIASSVEQDVLIDLGLSTSRAEEPVSGTRAYLLQERLRRGQLPSLARLLDGHEEALTLAERYAFYQVFFEFALREHRDALLATLRDPARMGGSGGRLRRAFVRRIFGTDISELSGLDAAFHAYLRAQQPAWVQAKRALSTAGDEWLQVGFESGAEAWRWTPVSRLPYVLRGDVRVLAGGARQAAVLVALEGGGKLMLVIRPGEVRLDRAETPDHRSLETMVRVAAPSVREDHAVSFRLHISQDEVVAEVGDMAPLRARGVRPSGRWGLEVGPRANVVWRGIRVE